MKKTTGKKRRFRISLLRLSIASVVFSGVLYFFSALFLRNYNNSLTTKAQSISAEITALQAQNDAIQVDIETLSSSDRVEGIAANNGMSRNQDSIITITGSENRE